MKYVIFVRLLCQELISLQDIFDAQEIINEFLIEYEQQYGIEAMRSNVHAHAHLPEQVLNYGPLNKTEGYTFENEFKITRSFFHGNRGHAGQIARGLSKSKMLKVEINQLYKDTDYPAIKHYFNNHFFNQEINRTFLLKPSETIINHLERV